MNLNLFVLRVMDIVNNGQYRLKNEDFMLIKNSSIFYKEWMNNAKFLFNKRYAVKDKSLLDAKSQDQTTN